MSDKQELHQADSWDAGPVSSLRLLGHFWIIVTYKSIKKLEKNAAIYII